MINGLSLFANVGIAETYLHQEGYNIAVANELLPLRCKFYKHLYPETEVICGDINDIDVFDRIITSSKKNNVQFIIATPPCQGMSSAGKREQNDIRNLLIIPTIEIIKQIQVKFILIENVKQILNTIIFTHNRNIMIKDYIKEQLGKDYNIDVDIYNAQNYLVPQSRKRAIFQIIKKPFTNNKPQEYPVIDLEKAIGFLPSLESEEKSKILYHHSKKHSLKEISWMKHTPTGKSARENLYPFYPAKNNGEKIKGFSTTYKRKHWDRPSTTITMNNGSISGSSNVHPGRLKEDGTYSDARVLTILELLIVTSLPENWNIPDWASDQLIRNVIGESMPPKMLLEFFKVVDKNAFRKGI